MSAQLANASASFDYKGANVHLSCSSPQELIAALATFGIGGPAANDTPPPAAKPATKQPEAAAGNVAPASTGTPASAPSAGSGSAAGGDAKQPDYNDVRDRVLKLSKVSREVCLATLGKFTGQNGQAVDHGNKLKLEDYPAFLAAADTAIAAGAKA